MQPADAFAELADVVAGVEGVSRVEPVLQRFAQLLDQDGEPISTGGAPAIGASGAVIAVFMLFAWHFPRHTILVFFVIPVEVRWLVIAYAIYDLFPVLRQIGGDVVGDGVAHSAHLGGLAFGLFYACLGLGAVIGSLSIGTVFAQHSMRRLVRQGLGLFALSLAGLALVVFRDDVVAAWPPAARLFNALGLA